ncbi:hypothetical protein HDU99_009879 [Rhizoclosmatium hyalinum]|nr:hypothetical protein HDU99_009879 [Rhizoclosmatium hyalinum]
MQFASVLALLAASVLADSSNSIDITPCTTSATLTAPATNGLQLPNQKSPNGGNIEFNIAVSDLVQGQTLTFSDACATLVNTVTVVSNVCAFTMNFEKCQSKKISMESTFGDASSSREVQYALAGTSTSLFDSSAINELDGFAIQVTKNVLSSPDNGATAKSTITYKLSGTRNNVDYFVDDPPAPVGVPLTNGILTSGFEVTGLTCAVGASTDVQKTFFSCKKGTVTPTKGGVGCSEGKTFTLTFVNSAASDTGCAFNVAITVDYGLTLTNGFTSPIVVDNDVSFDIGTFADSTVVGGTPKLVITSVKVETTGATAASVTLDPSCYTDSNNGLALAKANHGDRVKFHVEKGAFPTDGTTTPKCTDATPLAIFNPGTYKVTVNYKNIEETSAGRRRASSNGTSPVGQTKIEMNVLPKSGVPTVTIVGATVGSVAAVALIAVGAIVIRRRNLQKRAAAIKESEVLVAQEFVASA